MREYDTFEYVKSCIKQEGFHYCFHHYDTFEDIKDEQFHTVRKAYLEACKALEEYVENKVKEELEKQDYDEIQ